MLRYLALNLFDIEMRCLHPLISMFMWKRLKTDDCVVHIFIAL